MLVLAWKRDYAELGVFVGCFETKEGKLPCNGCWSSKSRFSRIRSRRGFQRQNAGRQFRQAVSYHAGESVFKGKKWPPWQRSERPFFIAETRRTQRRAEEGQANPASKPRRQSIEAARQNTAAQKGSWEIGFGVGKQLPQRNAKNSKAYVFFVLYAFFRGYLVTAFVLNDQDAGRLRWGRLPTCQIVSGKLPFVAVTFFGSFFGSF